MCLGGNKGDFGIYVIFLVYLGVNKVGLGYISGILSVFERE